MRKLCLLTVCLSLLAISSVSASWTNNDDVIDDMFWTSNPSDSQIISALYGDGNLGTDNTAYTKNRNTNNCDTSALSVVYLQPYSISGVDSIPLTLSGNTIYVLASGDYISSDQITYTTGCTALIGKGKVNLFKDHYSTDATIILEDNNHIVSNLEIDGSSDGLGGIHQSTDRGISFATATNIFIGQIRITNTAAQSIFLKENNDYTTISDFYLSGGSNGISVSDANNITISSGFVTAMGHMIMILGNTNNSVVSDINASGNFADIGIGLMNSNSNNLSHIAIQNYGGPGVYETNSDHNLRSDISIYDSAQGRYTDGNTNTTISGLTITNTLAGDAMSITNSTGVTVESFVISGATNHGINIGESDNTTVKSGSISYTDIGIETNRCTNATIQDINASYNTYGILFDKSPQSIGTHLTTHHNTNYGVVSRSNDSTLSYIDSQYNNIGIALEYAINGTISHITANNNDEYGVYINNSENISGRYWDTNNNSKGGFGGEGSTGINLAYIHSSFNKEVGGWFNHTVYSSLDHSKSHDNGNGLILEYSNLHNSIKNSEFYNNQAGFSCGGEDNEYNNFDNIIAYNNLVAGMIHGNNNIVNNSQFYNNMFGLGIGDANTQQRNYYNNTSIYNNVYGILRTETHDGEGEGYFNNLSVYNNTIGILGSLSYTASPLGTSKYFGLLNMRANDLNFSGTTANDDALRSGTGSSVWSDGQLILGTGIMTCDYVTNAMNASGVELLEYPYCNRRGPVADWTGDLFDGSFVFSGYTWTGDDSVRYTFFPNMIKQQQSYSYDVNTSGLVASGNYNTDSFVGDYEWTGASEGGVAGYVTTTSETDTTTSGGLTYKSSNAPITLAMTMTGSQDIVFFETTGALQNNTFGPIGSTASTTVSVTSGDGLKIIRTSFGEGQRNSNYYGLIRNVLINTTNQDGITTPTGGNVSTPGGGNGGGVTLTKDNCPSGDNSPSYYDKTCGEEQTVKKSETPIKESGNSEQRVCLFDDVSHISFDDIQHNKYRASIETLKKYCIVSGNGKDSFRPKAQITEAEFLKIVTKLLYTISKDKKQRKPSNTDSDRRYVTYYLKAKELKLIPKSYTSKNKDTFTTTKFMQEIVDKAGFGITLDSKKTYSRGELSQIFIDALHLSH